MAAGSHFGCPKNHFVSHLKKKLPPVAILDVQKSLCIAFLTISDQYHNFIFVNCFTKWLPAAILDVRKSLSVAFLAISGQYETFFIFFYKMTAVGHFGCPKFTLDHIPGHFRSIQIFLFSLKIFTKWLTVAILDVRKSLSISFLVISDRYAIFFFF